MKLSNTRAFWQGVISPFSWYQFFLANLGLGLLIAFLFADGMLESWEQFSIGWLWSSVLTLFLWTGNAGIVEWLDDRISWIERPVARVLSGLLIQSVYSVVVYMLLNLFLRWLIFDSFPVDIVHWLIVNSPFPIIISIGISSVFTAVGFLQSWRESERKAVRLESEMLQYKYESLRNQINPHFLFNSFNVLSDLIYEDQDQAALFLQRLSNLYRYVLDCRDQVTVPLERELNFAREFAWLLETRFEDKLQVDFEIEPEAGDQIVPMSLQLCIENAAKHNEASRAYPLRVKVQRINGMIEVSNVLRKKEVGDDSKGTGLAHLAAQYGYLTAQGMQHGVEGGNFVVRLPIIREEKK